QPLCFCALLRPVWPSLTDAEVAEDDVEQIFDIDGTGDAPEIAQGETEVFGAQLRQPSIDRPPQRRGGLFEGLAVAGSGQERRLEPIVLRDPLAERRQQRI